MNKTKRILIIISVAAVILGCIIGTCGLAAIDFDFTKLNTVNYSTNIYTFEEDFNNINIYASSANISFKLSNDNKCNVEIIDDEKISYNTNVQNNTLNIEYNDDENFHFFYFGINFSSPKITVSLPKRDYEKLNIKSSSGSINIPDNFIFSNADIISTSGDITYFADTSYDLIAKSTSGDVSIENIHSQNINASSTSGDINIFSSNISDHLEANSTSGDVFLSDISSFSISAECISGDVMLKNVMTADDINAETTSGDIDIINSDANNLYLSSTSGDISGSLISDKIFITDTNSGDIVVPSFIDNNKSLGVCKINTTSGDIYFSPF